MATQARAEPAGTGELEPDARCHASTAEAETPAEIPAAADGAGVDAGAADGAPVARFRYTLEPTEGKRLRVTIADTFVVEIDPGDAYAMAWRIIEAATELAGIPLVAWKAGERAAFHPGVFGEFTRQ